jgi:hypothetical protein
MRINDIIQESVLSWIKSLGKSVANRVITALARLGFGQKTTISLSGKGMSESADTKDVTGRIAEYACAYYLNESLSKLGKFVVETSSAELKRQYDDKIAQFKSERSVTDEQITQGTDAGNRIAEDIYNNIIKEGDDLAFAKYRFEGGERISVRNPANEGNTADLILTVRKDSAESVAQDITFSLKTYKGSTVSLGSSPMWMMLWKLFVEPAPGQIPAKGVDRATGQAKMKDFQVDPEEFAKQFAGGDKAFKIKDANKQAAVDYLNSPEGQAWAKKKEAERIARGMSPEKARVKPGGNFLRDKGVGQYLTKNSQNYGLEPGQRSDEALAKLFTQLHDNGVANLNQGDWKKYNEGIKSVLGFNVDVSYAAICKKKGITVVNSQTSQNFKDLYEALTKQVSVVLTYKPGSASLGVKLVYDGKEINTLTLNIWKDGTAQFQFDTGG